MSEKRRNYVHKSETEREREKESERKKFVCFEKTQEKHVEVGFELKRKAESLFRFCQNRKKRHVS